jgi:hypothetical protein
LTLCPTRPANGEYGSAVGGFQAASRLSFG